MSTINSHRQPQEEFSLIPNIPSDQLINSAFTNDIETSAILLNTPHTAIQLRRSLLPSSSSTTIFFRHSCCYYLWRFVICLITILFATFCCYTIYQFKIEHIHATNQTVYAIIHNNTQENTSDICKLFVSKLNLYYKIPASYISLMILFILILSQLFFRNRSCLKTSTCKRFWKHLSIPMIFNAHSHIYRFQSAAVFGILALEILHIFDEYIIHGAKHFYHGPLVDLAIQFGMGLLSGLRYCPILSIFEQENNYENRLENLISYGLGAIFLYSEIIFKFQSDTICPLDDKKMSIINQTLEKLHEMSVDAKVYLTENLGVEGTTKLNETYQKIPSWFKGKFESFNPDNINEVTNELTRLKDSLELNEQSILYNILRNAPYYYFIVYLAVCLTILFLKTFHKKCQKSSSLQSLPRWKYVKYNLLKTTKYIHSNEPNNYSCLFHCLNSLIVFFKQHIYSIRPYFRYSKLIICIYTSALTLVYYFTYWILDHSYILTKKLLLFLNLIVCGLSKSSNDLCFNLNMNSTDYENHINRNTRYICLITAFIICLQLFFALKHYQNQMCHAYRGVLLDMPQLKHLSSSSIISKSIHYPGRFMGKLITRLSKNTSKGLPPFFTPKDIL